MNDGEIIELLNKRDEKALNAISERYGGLCRSLIRNVLPDERDVEECMSTVLMKLWSSIPPAKPDNLKAYAAKSARNEALMRWRANRSRGIGELEPLDELAGTMPPVDDEVMAKELRASVERYLKKLPPEKRRVFTQRYWFMEPIAKIAGENGISESKTASMLFRIRNGLRKHLEKEGLIDEKR